LSRISDKGKECDDRTVEKRDQNKTELVRDGHSQSNYTMETSSLCCIKRKKADLFNMTLLIRIAHPIFGLYSATYVDNVQNAKIEHFAVLRKTFVL